MTRREAATADSVGKPTRFQRWYASSRLRSPAFWGCRKSGAPSRAAVARTGRNSGRSRSAPLTWVQIAAPRRPRTVIARSSSWTARGGSCIGRVASGRKRSGYAWASSAIPSLIVRAISAPSAGGAQYRKNSGAGLTAAASSPRRSSASRISRASCRWGRIEVSGSIATPGGGWNASRTWSAACSTSTISRSSCRPSRSTKRGGTMWKWTSIASILQTSTFLRSDRSTRHARSSTIVATACRAPKHGADLSAGNGGEHVEHQ